MKTAASASYSTRALVLRVRPLGEKDRLVTLFSEDRGRISAVAKGSRGPKSKMGALAQPFVRARFLLASGRSLHIITQAEIEESHTHLSADLLRLGWASLACELADRLPEGVPDLEAWQILAVTLGHLNVMQPVGEGNAPDRQAQDAAADSTGAWFLSQWLRHQGYSPTIGVCVDCGAKVTPQGTPGEVGVGATVAYSTAQGGTLCRACSGRDGARLTLNAEALRTWHRLERSLRPPPALQLTPSANHDLFLGLQRSLAPHLERRLKSQEFLDEVRSARTLVR